MSEERYTFEQARARLEEIAALVRKKDTSLDRSLELLEESVRLANVCTDLVDRTDLGATAAIEPAASATGIGSAADQSPADAKGSRQNGDGADEKADDAGFVADEDAGA